jgi:hypothetical protein
MTALPGSFLAALYIPALALALFLYDYYKSPSAASLEAPFDPPRLMYAGRPETLRLPLRLPARDGLTVRVLLEVSGPLEENPSDTAELEEGEGEVPQKQKQSLDVILERAKALNEALDISDAKDAGDEGEAEQPCAQFFLPDKVLNFPVVRDSDSHAYRAEAIRAFLEREMGLEKLLALKEAVADDAGEQADAILRDCEAGVVVLAQQLLVLEETINSI